MRLISLNIWEGRCGLDVLNFLLEKAAETDVFCLQEVFRPVTGSGVSRQTSSGDLSVDAFADIASQLTDFKGQFDPAMRGGDSRPGREKEEALRGLAIFHRRDASVLDQGNIFVFGQMNQIVGGVTARNLQYISICDDGKKYLICNFHGLYIGKGKGDTSQRIEQSQNIVSFLKLRRSTYEEEVILCGDFNVHPDTQSMRKLEKFGLRNLNGEYGFPTTRTRLRGTQAMDAPDYILISSGIVVKHFEVMQDAVSDHAPLSLVFS